MGRQGPEVSTTDSTGWPAPLIDLYREVRQDLVRIARVMLGSLAEAE